MHTAKDLGAHIHLAAGSAFFLLGLVLPDFLRAGTGLRVAGVARGLQEFGEFGFRLGDLVVIMDPDGPAILILIDVTVDFVGVQVIAKPFGFRFVFDFPNGPHFKKRAPRPVGVENSGIDL